MPCLYDFMKELSLDKDTFKALAGETRIQILKELNERRKTQSELAQKLGLSPPTVNEHVELLKKAGLVQQMDEGRKWKYYALTGKGKDLLNPSDTKIMLLLGTASVALMGSALVLFSRFYAGSNSTLSQVAVTDSSNAMKTMVERSSNDFVTGTTPQIAGGVADGAATGIQTVVQEASGLAGFTLPELAGLTILALVVGLLFGYYWSRRQTK